MRTIAVLQQKGGSGKTTLAVNLGALAHLLGHRTLIIDSDPQGTAFEWSVKREPGSKLDGLAVMQATKPLTRPSFDALARGYEVVLIDGPARRGELTMSGAAMADVVLLPVVPGGADLWALPETIECIDQADAIREQLGHLPVVRIVVMNRAVVGQVLSAEADGALRALTGSYRHGVVHQRTAFPKALTIGQSVFTFPAARAAATDIERLWRQLKRGPNASREAKPSKEANRSRRAHSGRGEALRG